ncbi:MAG: HPr kinase/phosphorylase [Bacteroidetes bacterium]|nr:HPr kinase/phosphorylase [Bacteroidota bacterium]MCH8522936.1 HPr(Ser) kinase/phosphatase [Balneolales bacterium]
MPLTTHTPVPRKERISVEFLIDSLRKAVQIEMHSCAAPEACSQRFVEDRELHRPGLALAGYLKLFSFHRIQILGNTECEYLSNLADNEKVERFSKLLEYDVPVIFLTSNNLLPDNLLNQAREKNIPIFRTPVETTKFMFLLRDFLEDQFAAQTIVHGSMVDVYGIGILITGKSGIGKSEVALDLIERGHRLVADDVVVLTKKNNILLSASTDLNKHFMEIRGLGIVDVMSMFGIRSVRYQKRLEVVVELFLWDKNIKVDRTGLDKEFVSVLDVNIPLIRLPISPGKNITVIAEVIAMNHLLQHYGYDAAKALQEKINQRISQKKSTKGNIGRAVDYFEGDFE